MINITENIFLTADTHFGHRRLVDWGRPEDFNELIVSNWNRVVSKKDIVLHLGDLTMINAEETLKYTSRLNGIKYMVLGNHDDRSVTWYNSMGFIVLPAIFKVLGNKYGEYLKLLFTHVPEGSIPADWINIHGHMHNNSHRGVVDRFNHIDIGVDCFDFTPVKLSKVLEIVKHEQRGK